MIYRDVELEEWCTLHKIEKATYKCQECGKDVHTTIPVETSKSYGLITHACECGNDLRGYVFTPKKNVINCLKSILEKLK